MSIDIQKIAEISNISEISGETFNSLISSGVAFVKIPQNVIADLKELKSTGKKYFSRDQATKNNNSLTPEKRKGYLNQNQRNAISVFGIP